MLALVKMLDDMSMKRWTEKDIERLKMMYGRRTYQYIGNCLGRTASSVSNKVYMLDFGLVLDNANGYTYNEISELTGVSVDTIRRSWVKKGLKHRIKSKYNIVKEKDLFDFMKSNPELWNPICCEKYFFENEKWFIESLENEINNPRKRMMYKNWDKRDIQKIISLHDLKCMTFSEIANLYDVNECSIKYIYYEYRR